MEFTQGVKAYLLSPAFLILALGVFSAVSKSDLKFPEPFHTACLGAVWLPALAAMAFGGLTLFWTSSILQRMGGFSLADVGAMATQYGSVSALTFIEATNFLKSISQQEEICAASFFGLMDSPVIIIGAMLGRGVFGWRKVGTGRSGLAASAARCVSWPRSTADLNSEWKKRYELGRRLFCGTASSFTGFFSSRNEYGPWAKTSGFEISRWIPAPFRPHRPYGALNGGYFFGCMCAVWHLRGHAAVRASRDCVLIPHAKDGEALFAAGQPDLGAELLREAGAHVHMAFNVSGNGQQGECSADFAKTSNLQAQVIVKLGAGFIVVRRHAKWFASYAVVAYESEVCVLRPGKYYHAAK
jgi:hypothetical protein